MAKESRTENAKKNILFGYISKIVDLLLPFISRTVILYILGEKYLGLSSLFTSILNMLNMTELGFSSAIVFNLYKPLADGDEEKVRGYVTIYRTIYRCVGGIILLVGILLTPFLKYLVKGDIPADVNMYVIYVMYLVNTSISYLGFAYKSSLLQATQKSSVDSRIASLINFSRSIAQIFVLLIVRSYYAYIAVLILATIANNLVINHTVNKMYPQYIGKGSLSKSDKQLLLTNVKGLAISKVCGVMRNSLDSITLSAFVGLTSVAIYGNYYYILTAVHGMMVVITVAIKAGVGNSIYTESVEKNCQDMLKFNYIYMSIASWCFTCMVCIYQSFMKLWAGEQLTADTLTMWMFAFYFYSLCMSDIRNVYIEAKGMWWEYRYRSIAETIANLILNVICVYYFGIKGVLAATLVTFWSINLIYGSSIIFRQYFGIKVLKKYIAQNLWMMVCCGVSTIATYIVCGQLVMRSTLLGVISRIAVCCTVPILTYLIFNLKSEYLKEAFQVVKRVIRR